MHGHITSLAVARSHRKLGIATRLMEASREHLMSLILCTVTRLSGGCCRRQQRFAMNQAWSG